MTESPNDSKPIALDAYEQIADEYARVADTKVYNADYERPATLSLLPDLDGKHVLDAGCGPGFYSEYVIEHGGSVIALDVTPRMVELARERLGNDVDIRLANLAEPLDFLEDESFDVIVSGLVLDYVNDWTALFHEFSRVLKTGGHFVFSFGHTVIEYVRSGSEDYFAIERIEWDWPKFGVVMPSYRRPLGSVFSALYESGFMVERFLEPFPTAACKEKDPETYGKLSKLPVFICIRAVKRR